MGHDKSGKGHIQHCGPAHQKSEPGAPKILGAIAAKVCLLYTSDAADE